jgi:predicted O-methyltransferase YrrM
MFHLQFVLDYAKYCFDAKNRHGLHSPFVYRLVDEVIYDFSLKSDYYQLAHLRQQVLHDRGSFVMKDHRMAVKAFQKKEGKSLHAMQLIYRLANYFSFSRLIELGSSMGIDTAYLAKAVPQAKIMSIGHDAYTASITSENLTKQAIKNVELLMGNSRRVLSRAIADLSSVDFLLINRGNRKDVMLDCFDLCLPKLKETSVVVVDAIYQNKEMKAYWQQIKAHPQVTVTLDLFQMGLAFVRPQQAEEHFKIRF